MIAIIDYGVGNLKSVFKAFSNLGADVIITSDAKAINNSRAIILPGVGAFKDAVENLEKLELIQCIKDNVISGKLTLGICLGMQLFYDKSYEEGECQGLGLLHGEIVRFKEGLKVPHMGWNRLNINRNDDIINGIQEGEYVYFVHSYYLKPDDFNEVVLSSSYGVEIPAVVRKDNIIGMQFHPEKSGKTGLKLIKNFWEMVR